MFDFLNHIPVFGGFLSTIIPFIIVLSIVVAIHEYGHYIVGRWCGIHAEVFSLGFGPVLASKYDKHGTKWQLAAIPLGGYVKFLGDADAASSHASNNIDPSQQHKTLNGAALYKKALTVFAGPAANFILSIFIFSGLAYYIGVLSDQPVVGKIVDLPTQYELQEGDRISAINGQTVGSYIEIIELSAKLDPTEDRIYQITRNGKNMDVKGPFMTPAIVGAVMPVSPASKAGLKEGDVFISVDGQPINNFSQLVQHIKAADNQEINLKIWRDGREQDISITPEYRDIEVSKNTFEKRMMIGISSSYAFLAPIDSISVVDAVGVGIQRTYSTITSSLAGIIQIITGKLGADNLQGPLGIAQMSADTASTGFLSFITLIAFISTAIGFLNLLPIPILDGGHLVIFLYEAIFRRPPNEKVIHFAMTLGLSLLLCLMVFTTFNDIMRF